MLFVQKDGFQWRPLHVGLRLVVPEGFLSGAQTDHLPAETDFYFNDVADCLRKSFRFHFPCGID